MLSNRACTVCSGVGEKAQFWALWQPKIQPSTSHKPVGPTPDPLSTKVETPCNKHRKADLWIPLEDEKSCCKVPKQGVAAFSECIQPTQTQGEEEVESTNTASKAFFQSIEAPSSGLFLVCSPVAQPKRGKNYTSTVLIYK